MILDIIWNHDGSNGNKKTWVNLFSIENQKNLIAKISVKFM